MAESSVRVSISARSLETEQENKDLGVRRAKLPSLPLMCSSAHGNNRLIKADKKKKDRQKAEVAPGHRRRVCGVLSFLQPFYFSDPPQAKAKHFSLCRPEYHSNLKGCKWRHYQALKGGEQEKEAACGG